LPNVKITDSYEYKKADKNYATKGESKKNVIQSVDEGSF
jgi:hypothetical protein